MSLLLLHVCVSHTTTNFLISKCIFLHSHTPVVPCSIRFLTHSSLPSQTPGRKKPTASRKILGEKNVSVASSLPPDESFLSLANSSMASAGSYTDFQVCVCSKQHDIVCAYKTTLCLFICLSITN